MHDFFPNDAFWCEDERCCVSEPFKFFRRQRATPLKCHTFTVSLFDDFFRFTGSRNRKRSPIASETNCLWDGRRPTTVRSVPTISITKPVSIRFFCSGKILWHFFVTRRQSESPSWRTNCCRKCAKNAPPTKHYKSDATEMIQGIPLNNNYFFMAFCYSRKSG